MSSVYFDHNATTPIQHAAKSGMLDFVLGNPSSIHSVGRTTKSFLDIAREQIALAFGIASEEEIIFTGSGTESINTVLKGSFFLSQQEGKKFHLVTSAVEHEATLESAKFIESLGAIVHFLEVDRSGQISVDQLVILLESLSRDSGNKILVSMMAANNETGIIFPIRRIAKRCARFGALLHVDAVQAPGKMLFSVKDSMADFVSFSGHKLYGPQGIGILYIRKGLKLVSLLSGGAQERKRRAGTHNVPGIIGFGIAAGALLDKDALRLEMEKIKNLRDHLEQGIRNNISGMEIVGAQSERLVNTSNILIPGVRGDSLLMSLDLEGFAVSTGSACSSGTVNPSHVLVAMGYSKADALSAIRISLGKGNTMEEVERFLGVFPEIVARIRAK